MGKNVRVLEAAEYLCLSKSSLDKMRCYGGGPKYYELGRAIIYNTDDLDAWRNERAVFGMNADNQNISSAENAA